MGDVPFVVGGESADVWSHASQFQLHLSLGAPPDDFSADGQDWGLPPYDWLAMEADDMAWLRMRARHAARMYDRFRLDHVVGYFRQWVRRKDGRDRGRFDPEGREAQQARGLRVLGAVIDELSRTGEADRSAPSDRRGPRGHPALRARRAPRARHAGLSRAALGEGRRTSFATRSRSRAAASRPGAPTTRRPSTRGGQTSPSSIASGWPTARPRRQGSRPIPSAPSRCSAISIAPGPTSRSSSCRSCSGPGSGSTRRPRWGPRTGPGACPVPIEDLKADARGRGSLRRDTRPRPRVGAMTPRSRSGRRLRWGARGTGAASTSPSSARTRRRSICACSTTQAWRRASRCRRARSTSGTSTCPGSGPGSATAGGSTARMPRSGAALQPQQAARRPVRARARRRARRARARLRVSPRQGGRRPRLRLARRRPRQAEERRRRRAIRLGRRSAAGDPVARDRGLRAPRPGVHEAASRRAGADARQVPRSRFRRGDRASHRRSASRR